MHVFVAGATGVLGVRLVELLADRGHEVVGLARDEAGEAAVRERGGEPHRGDLLEPETIPPGVEGADAVVHAATAIPTEVKPDDRAWDRNDRVRRAGTRTLTEAAAEAGADRYVQQSIVWVARQPDGSFFDEDAPTYPNRVTQSALDAERIAASASEENGFDVVVLRGGSFYGHDAAHTRLYARRLLDRRMPILGGGPLGRRDADLSWIHVDDVARGFADAVEGDATGTFHVVDDEPASLATCFGALADELGAPDPRRIPGWLARPMVGKAAVRFATSPMPTANERVREAFGWGPEYPTLREGVPAVVERWREDGTVEPDGEGGYRWVGE